MVKKSTAQSASSRKITKSAAARAAMEEGKVLPTEAVTWIKETYGIVMSPVHFSAIKSSDAKKGGGNGVGIKVAIKRGRKPKVAATNGVPILTAKGDSELLTALEAIKPLVASLGAARVKRLADLLA